jgi:hypothetical protein
MTSYPYLREFPCFDYDLPELPGYVDASWHNDACPKIQRALGDALVTVWCDYASRDRRELMGSRYAIAVTLPDDSPVEILATDSWPAIVASLRTLRWLD